MQFPRAAVLAILFFLGLFSARTTSAQTVLSVCTEEELAFALEQGGDYQIECISNLFTIQITRPLIVSRDVIIRVPGTNQVILTGSNVTRLMVILPEVTAEFEGFALFSGRHTSTNAENGGIAETAGGAIYNDRGKLTFLRGRFQANSVVGVTGAAGEEGTGESGESGGDAAGGAIYNNFGIVVVSNVVFDANVTTAGAGGKGANAQSTGLGGSGGNGGNGGSAAGSAIFSNEGTVLAYACTFTGNSATGAGAGAGGIVSSLLGVPGQPGEAGDGVGAAIAGNEKAILDIWGCTFANNSVRGANGLNGNAGVGRNDGDPGKSGGEAAGGAIYAEGKLTLRNSTFFRNTGTSGNGGTGGAGSSGGFGFNGGDGGNGGLASGGAVECKGQNTKIVHCTFSDNNVTGGTGGTGGAGSGLGESGDAGAKGSELGGAVYGSGVEATFANSIFANSRSSLGGNLKDFGGNITTDRNPLITLTNVSYSLASPSLLPLANNGGPTQTMGIRSNSIAIDKGVSQYCEPVDQRGTNRVKCDIGAFEFVLSVNPIASNSLRIVYQTNVAFGTNRVVTFQWPAGHTNITLQGSTNITAPRTNWVTVTNGIVQTNGLNSFTIGPNLGLPFAFYRLASSTPMNVPAPGSGIPSPPTLPGLTSGASIDDDLPSDESSDEDSTPAPPLPPDEQPSEETEEGTISPPVPPVPPLPGAVTQTSSGVQRESLKVNPRINRFGS